MSSILKKHKTIKKGVNAKSKENVNMQIFL